MLRKCAVAIILGALLAGCRTAPPPAAAPPTSAPAQAPAVTEPVPAPAAGGIPVCGNPGTAGPPSFAMRVADAQVGLPFASCRLTVPAGPLTLYFMISNLEPEFPVPVTGAPAGRWQDHNFLIDVNVAQGETKAVSLDLSGMGRTEPVTFTLVGAAPAPALIASAPGRQGPWTDVGHSGLVPVDHTWLRISYPLTMRQAPNSVVTSDQYTTAGTLPGVWDGGRTQYVDISAAAPVLYVKQTTDANGLPLWWQSVSLLIRGAPPELQAVTPADGSVRSLYRFDTVPANVTYRVGAVRYSVSDLVDGRWEQTVWQIDPATGKASAEAPGTPAAVGSDAPARIRYPSPDGKLTAELVWNGNPLGGTGQERKADLIIRDAATGQVALQMPQWLTSFGAYGCSNAAPGFAWRPDGQAVAALDAPAEDRIALKETSLKGEPKTLAERRETGAAYGQFEWQVTWSPDGGLVTFQDRLIAVDSGRAVAERLTRQVTWSPDGRYVLLYQPDHPFTNWGDVALLGIATGERRALGHGQALGWTPDGSALLVRWDVSRQIPAPGKGCL